MNTHTSTCDSNSHNHLELEHFDIRQFIGERMVIELLLAARSPSRRAAQAVVQRFAKRHNLQVLRMGHSRFYMAQEFWPALVEESASRGRVMSAVDRVLRQSEAALKQVKGSR
jgi:hypothetical protein